MENSTVRNNVGLYRMLIDASCAIFQNLSALSPLMDDDAIKSAENILRKITVASYGSVGDCLIGLFPPEK